MKPFGMHTEFKGSFDDAVTRVTEALASEGFGVLTQIDVKDTLKKKLDIDFRRYKILGACNPRFAHRALEANLSVGLLLPCNVAVYEEDGGTVHVAAIDPMETIAATADPTLAKVAAQVRERLERVITRTGRNG
jgi:uncharacterized protein (DUF302 family)